MPFWRRRSPSGPDVLAPAQDAGPLPGPVVLTAPPQVPAPPSGASEVDDRLRAAGIEAPAVELLGAAGPLAVWGWDEASGEDAVDRWRALRAAHSATGLWPVLLGPREEISDTFSFADGGDHDEQALAEGTASPAGAVIGRLLAEADADGGSRSRERPRLPALLDELPELFWVAEHPCAVALVPAAAGWQVPGLLSWWGAANVDLPPADHVAVLREWEQRYGAELVALTSDTVELSVARPPRTPEPVLQTAREQYAYCPDIVDQGAGTLESLCREQVPRRSWSFWWD